jgi:hypothetical protein
MPGGSSIVLDDIDSPNVYLWKESEDVDLSDESDGEVLVLVRRLVKPPGFAVVLVDFANRQRVMIMTTF